MLRPLALAALLSLGVAAGISVAPRAHSSVMILLTVEDLIDKSESVVVGIPKSRTSRWEDGRIVTYTTVAIDTAVAGSGKAGETMIVRTLGGAVDGIGQIAHGEAVLPLDKPLILFLQPSAAVKGARVVVGMAQGAMSIEVGTDKIARVAPKPADLVLMPKPGAVKAVPASATLSGKALPDAVKDLRALWGARVKK